MFSSMTTVTRGPIIFGLLFWAVVIVHEFLPKYPENSPEALILVPILLIAGLSSFAVFVSLIVAQWISVIKKRVPASWGFTLPVFLVGTLLLYWLLDGSRP